MKVNEGYGYCEPGEQLRYSGYGSGRDCFATGVSGDDVGKRHCEASDSCHSEGARGAKNSAEGRLREASPGLLTEFAERVPSAGGKSCFAQDFCPHSPRNKEEGS